MLPTRKMHPAIPEHISRQDKTTRASARVMKICLLLTVWLTVSTATALAKLPDAIVNTRAELNTVETEPKTQSADDLSRELSNPNTPLAKLTFENITTFYKGSLPDSDDQVGNLTLFQPIFPFPLADDGTLNLFIRPAFTFMTGQPSYDPVKGVFYDKSGFGDIGFDVALGKTYESGWIFVGGVQGTLPAGSESELTGGQLRLGPEFAAVYMSTKGFIGIFPQHQWDVSGWRDDDYATTNIELFWGRFLKNGVTLSSNPVLAYNWEGEQWTVPLNLTVKKVMKICGVPFQVGASLDYYVEADDDFGPDWAFGINLTPIVPNFIYAWLNK